MPKENGNQKAPIGYIYQCQACGKKSPWRYGWDDSGKHVADPGWDESCFLNAILVEKKEDDTN